MSTTKVVRTRLQNRTVSYAVAKHNGHKVPKDFKEWTWKTALTFLNGKSKKAKLSRTDFEKVTGYPVPDGSFRDLITGRTAKSKLDLPRSQRLLLLLPKSQRLPRVVKMARS